MQSEHVDATLSARAKHKNLTSDLKIGRRVHEFLKPLLSWLQFVCLLGIHKPVLTIGTSWIVHPSKTQICVFDGRC